MLNPQRLVVGGDLAAAGDLLLDGVRESIGRAALPAAAEAAGVVAGVLGERAQVLGALALVVSARPTRHSTASRIDVNHPVPGGGDTMQNGHGVWRARGRWPRALVVAGCGDDDSDDSGSSGSSSRRHSGGGDVGKVAVLLPDSKSSVRWETVDRPFLKKAFDAAGVEPTIQNAEGDKSDPAAAGRAGDHQRREGAAARQPRLRLRRGDRGQRASRRASRSSTTTA